MIIIYLLAGIGLLWFLLIVLAFVVIYWCREDLENANTKIENERHNTVVRKIYDDLREKQAKKI